MPERPELERRPGTAPCAGSVLSGHDSPLPLAGGAGGGPVARLAPTPNPSSKREGDKDGDVT
ncbi:MAG: hypothetical protein C0515_02695 [Novosphingobium sp.]|nr:hypothetical protein [Novosphingobium sp.]